MRFLNFIRGDGLHALIGGTVFIHAAVTLASGVEEAFHAAQVDNALLRRPLLWLNNVGLVCRVWALLMELLLGLHVLIGVPLRACLHLRLDGFVNGLALRDNLGIVLRGRQRGHSHVIWAHWHTLMDLTGRREAVGTILFAVARRCQAVVHVMTWFDHRWKLQLLVVEVIRLFASVPFPVSRNFALQANTLGHSIHRMHVPLTVLKHVALQTAKFLGARARRPLGN